jgi:DNA-binding CsgD family transcriptional regulator
MQAGMRGSDMLLEREVELGVLSDSLERAAAGNGCAVVLRGPAGIGKSALLKTVETLATERGLLVLRARGRELEREMTFGVARQLFEPALAGAGDGGVRGPPAGAAAVGARALGFGAGGEPVDRFAAIHGLYWLFTGLCARRPVLVTVDDLHWVDDASLAWLAYMVGRCAELPLVTAIALRAGDGPVTSEPVAALLRDPAVTGLALSPLALASTAEIVRATFGEAVEDGFCEECHDLTAGNPLLLSELLLAAAAHGLSREGDDRAALRSVAATTLAPLVLLRVAQCGADATSLARAVAVLGGSATVPDAAALARLEPAAAELAADQLAGAQVLLAARPLEFAHDLIKGAVYDDLLPGARSVAHRRAAEIVDQRGRAGDAVPHLMLAGAAGDPWVVERLRDAARDSMERGGPDLAVAYLRRALQEPPAAEQRCDLLLLLGSAQRRAGDQEAISNLEQALAAAPDRGAEREVGRALAQAYAAADRADEAVELLDRSLDGASADDRATLALLGMRLGLGLNDARTGPATNSRAAALHGELSALSESPPSVLVALAMWAVRTGRPALDAEGLAERAVRSASGSDELGNPLFVGLMFVLMQLERYDLAEQAYEILRAHALAHGDLQLLTLIANMHAEALLATGDLAGSQAEAEWALERAARFGTHAVRHSASIAVRAMIERDAVNEAGAVLAAVPPPRAGDSQGVIAYLNARAHLRAAQGRHEQALADTLELGERQLHHGVQGVGIPAWRSDAALLHHALGQTDEAHRLAAEELTLATSFGKPRALGVSLHALALVGGRPDTEPALREAGELLEPVGAPIELGRVYVDLGAHLRRSGQRVRARAELVKALDLAHHAGALRLARAAHAELAAAGAKPRRAALTGRDALTPSELRVAQLAAGGMSNREIAQSLFVTIRTITTHLTHTYQKLDITRREQLADALATATAAARDQ